MDAQTRLGWVELYQEIGNAGVVCRRCGISRPTLRKWWRRYQALGMAGLEEQSRRPHSSPGRKVLEREEGLILRWGLSGISCVGHDDGKEGTLAWHAAKHRLSLTHCSTSCWPAVIRRPPLAGTAWSTS